MKSYDVVFYEAFEEEALAIKKILPKNVNALYIKNSLQESGHVKPPASIISIRTQSQIPIEWGSNLQAVLSRSTGYDHLTAYRSRAQTRAHMGYLPLYCARAVAEQALLMLLSLYRKLPAQLKQFENFQRDGITGNEILGKSMLIVGVGNIGYELYKMARNLGMRVKGVDVVKRHKDVDYGQFKTQVKQADVIVSAMNLTEKNMGYFNSESLRDARNKPIFINISRGELSPLSDLLGLLKSGILSGVGLDVYPDEKKMGMALREGKPLAPSVRKPLRQLQKRPDVILTPHNAFNTEEAVERKASQSVEQLMHFKKHGDFKWPVPG